MHHTDRALRSIVGLPHEVRTAGGFGMRLCVFCGNRIIVTVENKTQDNKIETLRASSRVGGGVVSLSQEQGLVTVMMAGWW